MSEIPPTHVVAVPMSDVYTVGVAMPTGPVVTEVQWGIVGPPGEPGPAGLVWRGTWSPVTGYQATDAVAYAGPSGVVSSYVCLQDHTNQAPAEGADTAYWALLAQEGAQGPPGPPGSSMDVMDYLVSLTTTAPPGSGQLRLNNASQQAATWMWLDGFTAPGTDVKRILMLLHADALIDVQDKDDSTRHQQYRVTADPVDKGTYVEVPVVWVKGESPLVAQRALVALIREGSEGQQGPPGPGVAAGGATGQVLAKKSGTDYDTQWTNLPALPIYDEGDSVAAWTRFPTSTGTFVTAKVADSAVGGSVIRCTGIVSNFVRTGSLVPYDPNALYRLKVRVRQTVNPTTAGQSKFTAGLAGVAADGVTFVNRVGDNSLGMQHYIAVYSTALTVAGGWQEFVGYAKGVAATGHATAATSPSTPGPMHQNVRYIQPMMHVNLDTGDGVTEIDYVSLEIVPEPDLNALTDVTITSPATAQLLRYNGSQWANAAPTTVKTDLALTKTDVGLANVDNTSDVNKPVSTAQQTALNLKAPLASPAFTGNVTVSAGITAAAGITASNGSVTAPKAQLVVGDHVTAWVDDWERRLRILRLVGGLAFETMFTQGNGPYARLLLYDNVGAQADFRFNHDCTITSVDGSVTRPVPYAQTAGHVAISISNASNGSAVVNFPTGRFTQVPICVASTHSSVYIGNAWAQSTTQVTIGCRHFDGSLSTTTINCYWMATQMTPTSAPGPPVATMEQEPTALFTSTCRTSDCENEGIAFTGGAPDDCVGFWCGACGQEITDVTAA